MLDRHLNPLNSQSFFLFGARGVGKSTLLRERYLKDAFLLINLLDEDQYYSLSQRPASLSERLKTAAPHSLVILDEVQRVPALLNQVHLLIEERQLNFILSGSSSRKLKRGNANLLAGRALHYELFPFTSLELGSKFALESALNWGTLPSLLKFQEKQAKIEYLRSYVDIYLKEEIVAEQLIRNIPPFRKFLDVAAQMNSKIVNYSSIAREVGVTSDTIKQYFSILEDTYVGLFLPSFSRSIRKQQRQAPKFYFFDCGIPRAILRTNESTLHESTSAYGEVFEQFIILEILRRCSYLRKRAQCSYLRTKDGAEVDLIIEFPNKDPILIEIKSTTAIHPEHLRGLKSLSSDMKNAGRYCLSRDPVDKEIDGIKVCYWERGIAEILG